MKHGGAQELHREAGSGGNVEKRTDRSTGIGSEAYGDGRVGHSRFYRLLGKAAEADAAIRRAVQADPKHGVALFELAMTQMRARQMDQADRTLQQVAALPDEKFRTSHAMFLFDIGKREEGIREFEKLASKYPDDRLTRTRLVLAYLATKRTSDAEKLLAAALKRNEKDVDALEMRARIYLGAGAIDKSDRDVNQVLHFRPDSAEAHYLKARVHRARNSTQNYQQELGEALRLSPEYLDARLELSRSFRAGQRPETALEYLAKMPDEQRGLLPAIIEWNWILFDMRRDGELKGRLARALKQVRNPELLLQDALVNMRQKQFGASRASLDEILKENPENYRAVDTMLALFLAEKRASASVEWLKQHATRRPKSAAMQLMTRLAVAMKASASVDRRQGAITKTRAASSHFRSELPLGLASGLE